MPAVAKFKPQANVPEIIALQFADGKPVPSEYNEGEVLFTLVDGRPWYAPPYVAEKIRAAGIEARKPFEIVKKEVGRNQFEFQIRLLADQQGREAGRAAAASSWQGSAAHSDTQPRARMSTQGYDASTQHSAAPLAQSPITVRLCAALCAAVDAAIETEVYAEKRNMQLAFEAEDIRALAITVFIDQCKQNGIGGAR